MLCLECANSSPHDAAPLISSIARVHFFQVTWVAHLEVDMTQVPEVYHPLLRSGHALGARRWLTSLQRWSQHLNVLRSGPARYVCKARKDQR
jgi:hypothetical protein